jgi:hypothetical protein
MDHQGFQDHFLPKSPELKSDKLITFSSPSAPQKRF